MINYYSNIHRKEIVMKVIKKPTTKSKINASF